MKLVDTNVIIRSIAEDDPHQTALADLELATGPIFIPLSVLLETEWVLRSSFRMTRSEVNGAIRNLLAIEHVETENPDLVGQALELHAAGADFADMLHLCVTRDAFEMVTFDLDFAKGAVPGEVGMRLLK